MMKTERFSPDEIQIPPRLRAVSEDSVQRLQSSIEQIGMQTPITVRWAKEDDGGDSVVLVAGRHRLEATLRLKHQLVECIVFAGDEADARLWEIAENLHRADLTEAERREHIVEWVKLTAEKVSHGGTPLLGGMQPAEKAIRKAAVDLGVSKTTVSRAVAAESLAPEVKAAADHAGLGTVKRAALASQPSQAAQLAHIRAERDRQEAQKASRQMDRTVVYTEAQNCAEWLKGILDLGEVRRLAEWIVMLKPAELSAALLKDCDAPVFDKTQAGASR